jgi:predicted transposase YbfD/YdcC
MGSMVLSAILLAGVTGCGDSSSTTCEEVNITIDALHCQKKLLKLS